MRLAGAMGKAWKCADVSMFLERWVRPERAPWPWPPKLLIVVDSEALRAAQHPKAAFFILVGPLRHAGEMEKTQTYKEVSMIFEKWVRREKCLCPTLSMMFGLRGPWGLVST